MTSTRKRATTNGRAKPGIGQQLRAKGARIDLGGTMVTLRVDWEAIEALESGWGSLKAWAEALQRGAEGPMFRAVGDGVAACARDVPVPARSLMDPGRATEYAEALLTALVESGLWKEDAEGNSPGPTAPSPGSDSSTSMSSVSASAPSSSGT